MSRGAHGPFLLAVVLVLASCGDEAAPASDRLVPGAVCGGLRLSARLDALHGLIRYEVENVGAHAIAYARGHLGQVLEARRVGEATWTELAVRQDQLYFVSGMGPLGRDVRSIPPGGALPGDAFPVLVAQDRFTALGPHDGLEVPPAKEAQVLDLLAWVWPPSLGDPDDGAIEVRVVQVFPDWSELLHPSVHAGRVASAVLRLELGELPDAVRSVLRREGRD